MNAADIDAVLLSHLHVDHVGGLINEVRCLPECNTLHQQTKADFWLTTTNKATANKIGATVL
ncbi:MBL fold metallo-hydrolase [Chitinophaga pinensis]|uniref:MBL fold metallo-hydrolase n=1 Tax=Chitinophaga pinensis TaxID=79329 RepID=UPI0039656DFB